MKKLIALILALVMTFSISVVAFAAEGETPEDSSTEETTENKNPLFDMSEEEIMDLIKNMDVKQAKFIPKIAKAGIKIALILDKLGFIDLSPIKTAIFDAIWDLISGYVNKDGDTAETPNPEVAA